MLEILLVLTFFCFEFANCKYCTYRAGFGKTTHFYCGAFEYCCRDRCCENFDEFYKLWYFWLCVLVLILSGCIAVYWLKRKYSVEQIFEEMNETPETNRHRTRRRRRRRYRQLSGDLINNTTAPDVIIPESVTTSPPPYSGENTGCPHPGPPPYTLGSGSSINSTTLPRFPPSYSQVEKEPPPSYSSIVEVVVVDDSKKSCDSNDTNDPNS